MAEKKNGCRHFLLEFTDNLLEDILLSGSVSVQVYEREAFTHCERMALEEEEEEYGSKVKFFI